MTPEHVSVPVEPTDEMVFAGCEVADSQRGIDFDPGEAIEVYKAMIAAAPRQGDVLIPADDLIKTYNQLADEWAEEEREHHDPEGHYYHNGLGCGSQLRSVTDGLVEAWEDKATPRPGDGLAEPYAEVWCPVFEGAADYGAVVIGKVHDMDWSALDAAYSDICSEIENAAEAFDGDVVGVTYRLTNLVHEPGQQTFPETGQWDFPPYWAMNLDVIAVERHPEKEGVVRVLQNDSEETDAS